MRKTSGVSFQLAVQNSRARCLPRGRRPTVILRAIILRAMLTRHELRPPAMGTLLTELTELQSQVQRPGGGFARFHPRTEGLGVFRNELNSDASSPLHRAFRDCAPS